MLSENKAELGHLEASRLKLEELLKQALDFAARQAALRADKQDASQRMKTVILDGQRLTKVLRLAVREHYGPRVGEAHRLRHAALPRPEGQGQAGSAPREHAGPP